MIFGASIIDSNRAARVLLLLGVVGGEVRANLNPGVTPVNGFKKKIASEVEHVAIMRRKKYGRVPVKTIGLFAQLGLRPDSYRFARPEVISFNAAHLEVTVEDIPFLRVNLSIKAVAAAAGIPHVEEDAGAVSRLAWSSPVTVILEANIDIIGVAPVIGDVVDFSPGGGLNGVTMNSSVPRDIEAAVIAADNMLRIMGVNPDYVMVWMGAPKNSLKGSAPVSAHITRARININYQLVIGVHGEAAIIKGTEIDAVIGSLVGRPDPGLPFIL